MTDAVPDPGDAEADLDFAARIEVRTARLDLAAEFRAAGSAYSELDENGHIVTWTPPAESP